MLPLAIIGAAGADAGTGGGTCLAARGDADRARRDGAGVPAARRQAAPAAHSWAAGNRSGGRTRTAGRGIGAKAGTNFDGPSDLGTRL
jgi:hypothetical protein